MGVGVGSCGDGVTGVKIEEKSMAVGVGELPSPGTAVGRKGVGVGVISDGRTKAVEVGVTTEPSFGGTKVGVGWDGS